MGLIKLIISAVVGIFVLLLAIGGIAYAADYGVEATVVDKNCVANEIVINPKYVGQDVTVPDIPPQQCSVIQKGNYLKYHVRSERTSIWASEGGSCVYDTEHGVGGCDE